MVHRPDQPKELSFEPLKDVGSSVYNGSLLGLDNVVAMLIGAGADINAQRGRYGNALQAASYRGHEKVVQMLMNAGAKFNVQGGRYDAALQAASWKGHEKEVEILLNAGADVNAGGGTLWERAEDVGVERPREGGANADGCRSRRQR